MRRAPGLSILLSVGLMLGLVTSVPTVASAQEAPSGSGGTVADVAGLQTALGDDTVNEIILEPGTYELDGPLRIERPVTITAQDPASPGPGSTTITIKAGTKSRVIEVAASGVTIEGVVVTGGDVTAEKKNNSTGGGIRVGRNASLTLVQSTVTGNRAVDGGGVENSGTLTVESSTFNANEATGKGGAIENNGTATVRNSTIARNNASQGGGLNSPGTTEVVHATIVQNVAGSSSSGGVDRNGGTLTIEYSIIANNLRNNGSEASDCSGTPDLLTLNLVSDSQGCNPVGEVIEAAPVVAALADNGGPTKTVALLDGSPAIDAVTETPCAVDVDQRGTARPTGAGCDLGAFEVAPLSADLALEVDTANYESLGLDPGTVQVGAVTIPTTSIQDELVRQEEESLASTGLRSIGLRSIGLRSIPLRSIDLQSAPLRSIPLRSIGLEAIGLRSIPLRSIDLEAAPLRSILLSEIPLRSIDGGWEEYLAESVFAGLPLQSVTLEDVVAAQIELGELTLADIDLEASPLRSIGLRSILLADAPLRSIPLNDALATAGDADREAAWCEVLGDICGDGSGQISSTDLGALDLLSVQLAGIAVDDVPIFDIPLDGLASTPLRSIPLQSIPLRSIEIDNTPLRSIPLRSIGLRSIDLLNALVDCGADALDCENDTLGDAAQADALTGDIGTLLDSIASIITLGCADATERAETGEQTCTFVEGLTFGDLLLAFVAPDDPAWEALDLENTLLQNIADPLQPTFDYRATVTVTNGPADITVTLMLPEGFAAARAPGDDLPEFDGAAVEPEDGSLSTVTFVIDGVGNGEHTLVVPARAGLRTGAVFTATAELDARQGTTIPEGNPFTATADIAVVDALNEGDGESESIPGLLYDDGEKLQLAHISREDDYDLYQFTAPDTEGAQARILLSNVPEGVDYDLTVYTPRRDWLRNEPVQSLSSLGDIGFDLSPVDDVYSTDVVDDIQLSIPGDRGLGDYSVRDTSTKRSSEDEEVGTGPLEPGQTYYVAVTSYNAGLSPEPYGLRIRLDGGVDLPATCAAPRFADTPLDPPLGADIPSGANTLYVTNSQWLSASLAAENPASEVGVSDIAEAAMATVGTNGVVAGFLPVDSDADIQVRYAEWDANRCDVDARNAVVSSIGALLDETIADHPTIENVVILGGDGVVPMAAVPDLTEFSNESTFATETTFNGTSNELTAALANGYLLSDDPYATSAGISIQNDDHELFMPTWNVGRLVETGQEILDQLTNFVDFGGTLDPGTAGALAAGVTGYDFLDDGSEAVAAELDNADGDGTERLISPAGAAPADAWNKGDFLDFLAAEKYGVLSPNAHYDYESLLPAADDGTFFTQDDLVLTGDVDTQESPFRLPSGALILTMGCHAGLSVDDVQVGLTVPDWAQTYAGDNVYAAHTTYGYGDTEIVAYSERLTQVFARTAAAIANGGAGSLGDALRDAKQEYLATTLVLTPYDEKILQSMTYYGLPMYRIEGGAGAAAAAPQQLVAALDSGSGPEVSPVEFQATTSRNGMDVTPVQIRLEETTGITGPSNLNLVSTQNGNYYEVGGNAVAAQYRPIQPLVTSATPGGQPSGGLLITGLTSQDFEGFDPLYLQPTIDLGGNEGRIEPGDGSFPASLQRIAPGGADGPERLLVAAGQFQDLIDGPGRQRIFTSIDGDLYAAIDTPSTEPPGFGQVIGRVGEDEAVVQFEVTMEDPAERVYVLFREIDPSSTVATWRGLDLFNPGGGEVWLGGAPIGGAGAEVEFFVQSVGANGRVGITDNKVFNYLTSLPDEVNDLVIDLDGEQKNALSGYYTGPVTARVINSASPETVEYSVDTGPFLAGDVVFDDGAPNAVEVSGNGGHVVLARDVDGGREYVFFVIDQDAPMVESDVFDPIANGPVTVQLTATDVGQSGVSSIQYTITDPSGVVGDLVTVTGVATADIEISAPGTSTITAVAEDRAGNVTPTELEVTVTIDDSPPTLSVTTDPPDAEGRWVNEDVTVTVVAEDDAGISDLTIDGTSETPPSATRTYSTDGETTVSYSATDEAGNTAEGTVTLTIDKTKPTATVTTSFDDANGNTVFDHGETASANYSCQDALSGVQSCVVKVDGSVVEDQDSDGSVVILTGTQGTRTVTVTATDQAGNTFTATTTFTVPFRVCLDYDPDQAKNIGSNYTIKLRLCDADGTNLSSNRVTLIAANIDGDPELDPGPNDSGNANDGYEFRYRSSGYIYNLDTTGFDLTKIGPGKHFLVFYQQVGNERVYYSAPFTLSG